MIPALLLAAAIATDPYPPPLPEPAEYSGQLLAEWMIAADLDALERGAVAERVAGWDAAYDEEDLRLESEIVRAMETTWSLPPGSEEREAAALQVRRLEAARVHRQRTFVRNVRRLIFYRGLWPEDRAPNL